MNLTHFSEFHQIQREEPLQLPPKPPQSRNWRGSIVAPFAGNNMLVLHSCPANLSNKYFVQVLHNEHPIPMPVSSRFFLSFALLLFLMFYVLYFQHSTFNIILTFVWLDINISCFCEQGCDGTDFCPFDVFKVLTSVKLVRLSKAIHPYSCLIFCASVSLSCRKELFLLI